MRSIDSIGSCLSRLKASRAEGPARIVLAAVFRFVAHPLIVGVTLSVLATVCSFAAEEPRRVLVVHSFGSAAPPFTVDSMASFTFTLPATDGSAK